NPYGASRFDGMAEAGGRFASTYDTPGWQRARGRQGSENAGGSGQTFQRWPDKKAKRSPALIEGELVASSTSSSQFNVGERVFHEKFGYGEVTEVDGNKLTVAFDKAGSKKVVDSFLDRA
ncbi:MAG: AAA family ATPase, partial [Hyphomicrobiaceae bacterium]